MSRPAAASAIATGETPGPFAIRRHPDWVDGIRQNPPELKTMKEVTLETFKMHSDKPYLSARELLEDGTYGPEFIPITYAKGEEIAYKIGHALAGLGIGVKDILGVYAPNCFAWIHTIDASSLYGFVIASLYDSLGADSISYLINHSQMGGIIVAKKNLPKLLPVLVENKCNVKFVVVIEADGVAEAKQSLDAIGVDVYSFEQLIGMGEGHPDKDGLPSWDPEDAHYLSYSSGTTGNPKGVILSHRACVSAVVSAKEFILGDEEGARYVSFLPLAHVFERVVIQFLCRAGGFIGFNSGGVARLMEDIGIFKPTLVCAVPRVFNRIYDGVMAKLNNGSAIKRGIFWTCWYAKRRALMNGGSTALYDKLCFNGIKEMLGGNVKQFVVGAAALDPKIHEFIQVATGWPVRNGYGLTEACAADIVIPMGLHNCKLGRVGGPLYNMEVKLNPIEGYDDPECGEICLSGPLLCSGYLHDPEATAELFTDETHTMIKTGDVGKWDEDGYMQVVDRIRSIFKLAQGEYVAAEYVTQAYSEVSFIKQLFVYGDSSRPFLVGVIIPKESEVARFLGKTTVTPEEYAEACNNEALKKACLDEMNEVAKKNKLFGYQFIKAIHMDSTEWTIENDMLTPTSKLKRKVVGNHYKQQIEQLYANYVDPTKK